MKKLFLFFVIISLLSKVNSQIISNLNEEFKYCFNPSLTGQKSIGSVTIMHGYNNYNTTNEKEVEDGIFLAIPFIDQRSKIISSFQKNTNYGLLVETINGQLSFSRLIKLNKNSYINFALGLAYINQSHKLPNVIYGDQINSNGSINSSSKENNSIQSYNSLSLITGISAYINKTELAFSFLNITNNSIKLNDLSDRSIYGISTLPSISIYANTLIKETKNTKLSLVGNSYINENFFEYKFGLKTQYSYLTCELFFDHLKRTTAGNSGLNINFKYTFNNFSLAYGFNSLFVNGNHELGLIYKFENNSIPKAKFKPSLKSLENEIL